MAMSSARLSAYLDLERAMLELDGVDDPFADQIRDTMDSLWHALTAEERTFINARGMILDAADVFCDPIDTGPAQHRADPVVVADWECPV